jgi:hypothetical protein
MSTWKGAAIVLIVVLILENIFIGYLVYTGGNSIDNKAQCMQTCNNYDSNAYLYTPSIKECLCYKQDEVIYKGVIK